MGSLGAKTESRRGGRVSYGVRDRGWWKESWEKKRRNSLDEKTATDREKTIKTKGLVIHLQLGITKKNAASGCDIKEAKTGRGGKRLYTRPKKANPSTSSDLREGE